MFKKNGWKEPIRPLSVRGWKACGLAELLSTYSPLHMSARTLLTRWNFHCYGAVVVQKDITRHPSSLCSQNCAKEKLKVYRRERCYVWQVSESQKSRPSTQQASKKISHWRKTLQEKCCPFQSHGGFWCGELQLQSTNPPAPGRIFGFK